MTRRMQANKNLVGGGDRHGVEHDETSMCQYGPRCRPVKEKPVSSLADVIRTLPAHGTDALTLKDRVLDLVRDTVTVPDTGVYYVIDGVTHTVVPPKWKPKPFFEEGKTYRKRSLHTKTFRVLSVDEHPESGVRVAVGWITDAYATDRKHTFMGGPITSYDEWEEVTS